MNILMISHYAGAPQYGMEFRSYYMGREWVSLGHKVMIVGASFSHLRKQQPSPGRESIDGIQYQWLPTRSYDGNGIGRIITMYQFVRQVFKHTKEFVKFKPDVVIASSVYTFDIYPCRHIARKTGAKLVYEVHDLWPLSPMIIGGYSRMHPFIWLLQRGEDYAYRHTNLVVSIPDKTFPHMQRHGLDEHRYACIPNGFLLEEWNEASLHAIPEQHAQLFSQLRAQGKLIIGFAGGHTQSTAMQVLVEAAHKLSHRTDIAFVFIGQGPQKEELVRLANKYDLCNISFLPPVEKKCIPNIIKLFNIGYAGGVHSILHQYGTSFNKVTDYMMAKIPIIFSVDEPRSLVERLQCGIQVEAENVTQVCQAIEQLANLSDEERKVMGQRGYDYAYDKLNYTSLSKKFIQLIEDAK